MNIKKSPLDAALGHRSTRPKFATPDAIAKSRRGITVPPDYHPAVIRGDGPASARARVALGAVHNSWSNIAAAAADKSVDNARLARAANNSMGSALKTCDDCTETIQAQITHFEKLLAERVQPKMSPELAVEIRGHLQRLGRGSISKVRKAVEEDVRVASAVLSGPALLSGLDERQLDMVRLTAHQSHAPREAAQLREAQEVLAKVNTAGARLAADIGKRLKVWSDQPSAALSKLEGGDES